MSVIVSLEAVGIVVFCILILATLWMLIAQIKHDKKRKNHAYSKKKITMLSLSLCGLAGQVPYYATSFKVFLHEASGTHHVVSPMANTIVFWALMGYIGAFSLAQMTYMLFGWIEAVTYINSPSAVIQPHRYKIPVVVLTSMITLVLTIAGIVVLASAGTDRLKMHEAFLQVRYILIPFLVQAGLLACAFAFYGYRLRRLVASKMGASLFLIRYARLIRRLNRLNVVLFFCVSAMIVYYSLLTAILISPKDRQGQIAIPIISLLPSLSIPIALLWFFNPRAKFEEHTPNGSDASITNLNSVHVSVSSSSEGNSETHAAPSNSSRASVELHTSEKVPEAEQWSKPVLEKEGGENEDIAF